ncbi:MAG: hypothetical protein ACRDTG_22925 [Pseudonocardiaceae bacterium]
MSDHDYILALGVKPVGVAEWYGEYPSATWPWAQDGRFVDYGMPWEVMRLTIGRILGQEEQAMELVSQVKTRLDEAAEQHP